MNKYGFFTNLFMSVVEVVFIIGSIFLFYIGIKIVVDIINIKNRLYKN